MSELLYRTLNILKVLPRFPDTITTKDIRNYLDDLGYEVDYRTVQRNIEKLQDVFFGIGRETVKEFKARKKMETGVEPALTDDDSDHHFWNEDTPIINFYSLKIHQALSMCLLKKFLTPLFPRSTLNDLEPFFDAAAKTLGNLQNKTPLTDWPNKIAIVNPTQPLLTPEIDPAIHEIVSGALLNDHQLKIQYRRTDGVVNDYKINPLGLVLRNGSCYLVATKTENQEKRVFVLHRILEAHLLDDKAVRPEGYDLQRFIDEGHMGFDLTGGGSYHQIKLKAIFDPITANHLSESRLSEDQVVKKLDDQHYEVTATVQETEQLFWWLLSFGFRVEVLEPPALRAKMANSVKVLAEKYQIDKIS